VEWGERMGTASGEETAQRASRRADGVSGACGSERRETSVLVDVLIV
jgi:hypothetical protein